MTRRVARVVVGVVLLLCVGGAWALASPLGSSPDEGFHLASIWCSPTARTSDCVRTGTSAGTGIEYVNIPFSLARQSLACFIFQSDISAGCQVETPDAQVSTTTQANDGLYPGGFHDVMGLLVSPNVTASVLAMRMASWVLCVGLLAAAALVATAVTRRAVVLAAVVTAVPMSIYLFASINPSGVAIAGIGALWAAAFTFMCPAVEGRRLVWSGVVAGAAALAALEARSDAGVLAIVTVGAVWLMSRGYRDWRNRRTLLLVAIAVAGAIGVALGSGTGDVAAGLVGHPERSLTEVLFYDLVHLPQIMLGGLGLSNLGWADTVLPDLVWIPMLMVVASVVTIGLRRADSLRGWCVGLLVVVLGVLPLYVFLAGKNYVGEQVQARYFLPLLVVIVGTALLADRERDPAGFGRTHLIVFAVAISVAQSVALHTNIRRYVTGTTERGIDLDHNRQWWWLHGPSPMVVWLVGTVAFAAVCAWLLLTFGTVREPAVSDRSDLPSTP